jgi:hypothetical protein
VPETVAEQFAVAPRRSDVEAQVTATPVIAFVVVVVPVVTVTSFDVFCVSLYAISHTL